MPRKNDVKGATCPNCGCLKAAAYARISDDQKGERLGVDDQIEDAWARISQEGWCTCTPEEDTYCDNDIGAYRRKRRPEYERLLEALDTGRYRILVARDDDRFYRNMIQAAELAELVERRHVQVVTLWAGHWDITTAAGRKRIRDGASAAQYEAEKTGERVARSRLRDARKGKASPGGQRPWGFGVPRLDAAGEPLISPRTGQPMLDTSKHNDEEAAAIRDVAQRLLAGESLRSASLRYGKAPKDVRRALLAPRMIGKRAYHSNTARNGEEKCTGSLDCPACLFFDAEWDPILDRDTWEAVRVILSARNRDKVAGVAARKYLLTGFLYCGECGFRCYGFAHKRPSGTYLRYCCHPRGCVVRSVERLDEHVTNWLLPRLELPDTLPGVDPALSAAVAGYETRLMELETAMTEPGTPVAAIARAYHEVQAKLEEARGKLAQAMAEVETAGAKLLYTVPDTDILQAVWDAWQAADLRPKRLQIAKHVDRIIINKSSNPRQFDPYTIEIVPKRPASVAEESPGKSRLHVVGSA